VPFVAKSPPIGGGCIRSSERRPASGLAAQLEYQEVLRKYVKESEKKL
jgi:hypothetical protein